MLSAACLASILTAPPTVTVSFDATVRAEPATGRLVLYLDARGGGRDPADGPFFDDPQPMFGVSVTGLAPGAAATIDDAATPFPCPWSELPPGTYRARAVLDLHRLDSRWRREPGNLFSDAVTIVVPRPGEPRAEPVHISLSRVVAADPPPEASGVERFEVRSELLSAFHGREVTLRAGVILPLGYVPGADRKYAAVYEVPGFGGDHRGAFQPFHPYRARLPAGSPWITLRENAFWIVLDPESGNGHTLLADSANNGPCGRALVEELIPALERRYPLAADARARLLRGHSSGGWSTLWLALHYPDTFGACWSSSPDPVDFRRMQLCDIYGRASFYALTPPEFPTPPLTGDVPDTPSYRTAAGVRMTVRQENMMEEVLGPDNTSGQQWDSWFAVWGPRNHRGNPAALFDPATGVIDRAVAERYRDYDIAELVRRDPGRYALLFQERIRLVVGDRDNYYLNEAVALLKQDVEKVSFLHLPEGGHGFVTIVLGRDHGSILATPEVQGFVGDMVDHLRRAGYIPG